MAFLLLTGAFTFHAFAKERTVQDSNAVSVAFEVSLEFEGEMPVEHDPFTFILEEEDGSPLPDSPFVTIDGEGVAEFDEIDFTEPGEYIYHVYERDDGVENFVYDDSVYTIDVDVKYDNDGDLVATYTAYSDEVKEPEILFINLYDDDVPIPEPNPEPEPEPDPEPDPEPEPEPEPEPDDGSEPTEATTTTEVPNPSEEPETTVSNNSTITRTSSGTSNITSTPKTGDNTNIILWIVLLCVAAIGMIGCMRYLSVSKKRDKDKNK
jgi:pilin isopeptide linkage protein